MVRLISDRAEQLNCVDDKKYPPLNERVKGKVVSGASTVLLAAMELFDDSIDYPVLLIRNGRELRIHKDIILPQHIRNYLTLKIGDRFLMGDITPDLIAMSINANLQDLDVFFRQQ